MKNTFWRLAKLLTFSVYLLFSYESAALTNSEPALESDFESVVFLKADDLDKNGEVAPAFCNGALVAPHVIITAAHCVRGNQALKQFQIEVEVGAYKYKTGPDGKERRIGYVPYLKETVKAQYFYTRSLAQRANNLNSDIGPSEDIAVVVLQSPLSLKENFPFAKVISQKELSGVLPNLTGYWPTIVSSNLFEEMSLDVKRKARLNNLSTSWRGYLESNSTSRVQPGDSGAPLFFRIGTQWKLGAVVKGKAETFFSNWDVYGSLDQKICEIADQIPNGSIRTLLCIK